MYAPTSLGAPALLRERHGPPPLLRGRGKTMCTAKGSDIRPGRRGTCTYSLTHSLTHSPTHPLTHTPTHTQSLTPSLPHSLPPSLPPSPAHSLTSLHFTSLHFTSLTPSLTHSHTSSSSSSCASDVYQPQGMQKEFTKCAAALERVQNITLVSESMVSTPSF